MQKDYCINNSNSTILRKTNLPLLKQNVHKGKCIYNAECFLEESRFGSRLLLINPWPNFKWID